MLGIEQALRAHSTGCWLALTGRYFVEIRWSTAIRRKAKACWKQGKHSPSVERFLVVISPCMPLTMVRRQIFLTFHLSASGFLCVRRVLYSIRQCFPNSWHYRKASFVWNSLSLFYVSRLFILFKREFCRSACVVLPEWCILVTE